MLTPSANCINLIKRWEKCRLKAYLPTPNDVPTIGWGATGKNIRLGDVWTQAEADARLATDVAECAAGVRRLIETAPTTQNQFDALVSFAYNVGLDEDEDTKAEGLGDSTLLRLHKRGLTLPAAREFRKWNKQKGKVLNGLTKRRAEEANLYLGVLP